MTDAQHAQAERLQAAIDKLAERHTMRTPGPWFLTYETATHPRIWGNADENDADHVATTARSAHDAELIVMLHRTIDAQLVILRHALARAEAKIEHGGKPGPVWSHEFDALALADAILGDAPSDPVCTCGHPSVAHHGTDRGTSDGCFGEGRGLLDPERCACRLTCSDVRAPATDATETSDWTGHTEAPVSESELNALITEDYSGGKLAWR